MSLELIVAVNVTVVVAAPDFPACQVHLVSVLLTCCMTVPLLEVNVASAAYSRP